VDIRASCSYESSSVSRQDCSISCRISRVRFAFYGRRPRATNCISHARRRSEEIFTRYPCLSVSSMRTDPCHTASRREMGAARVCYLYRYTRRDARTCVGTSCHNTSRPNLYERGERGSKEVVCITELWELSRGREAGKNRKSNGMIKIDKRFYN